MSAPDRPARRAKVLVAEDDQTMSHLICTLVRQHGWEAMPAMDAMQAVMFALRSAPDAILLDINMPGGTGLNALRRLKASVKTMAIPVVVLSGAADAALPDTVRSLGAAEFLSKPVDPPALIAALERVIG